jgi:hypothetical protein
MKYPAITIDCEKFRHNVRTISDLCQKQGIEVVGVNKVSGVIHYLIESFMKKVSRRLVIHVLKIWRAILYLCENDASSAYEI